MSRRSKLLTILAGVLGLGWLFQSIPISRSNDAAADFDMQVVLGGNTRERSDVCHELWLRHPTPILVTGDDNFIRDELLKLGIPASQIIHEPTARNTWQNAQLSVPILRKNHVSSAVIVTSWFHTARAHACFARLDTRITFASQSDPSPSRYGLEECKLATKERMKRLAYWISHDMNPWRAAK
ncbi:MAG: YdcF family protein [Verrucomicrobia bacterium]|nr:YdcF family protein [Verrucomicrobiota bacterium]